MRKKVLINQKFFGDGLDILKKEFDLIMRDDDELMSDSEIREKISDADGAIFIVTSKVNEYTLGNADKIKISANYGVGYDNVDVEYCTKRGIQVTNTPDVLTDATAEIGWALLLSAARRVTEGERAIRNNEWKGFRPEFMLGSSVSGKTLGIIGAGRIGRRFAEISKGFNMKIIYSNRSRKLDFEESTGATYVCMDELLGTSDFISVHVPYNAETTNLISDNEFKKMKKSAIFINTSRGPIVDENALIKALKNKTIRGAGLDVFVNEPDINKEFFTLNNIVMLPHLGSATFESRNDMGILAAQNVIEVLNGKKPITPVNKI